MCPSCEQFITNLFTITQTQVLYLVTDFERTLNNSSPIELGRPSEWGIAPLLLSECSTGADAAPYGDELALRRGNRLAPASILVYSNDEARPSRSSSLSRSRPFQSEVRPTDC
jgi:hypothetical protein